jgi:hypothetical protein
VTTQYRFKVNKFILTTQEAQQIMYIFDNMYSAEKFLEISPNASLENEDKNAGNGRVSLFSRNRKE